MGSTGNKSSEDTAVGLATKLHTKGSPEDLFSGEHQSMLMPISTSLLLPVPALAINMSLCIHFQKAIMKPNKEDLFFTFYINHFIVYCFIIKIMLNVMQEV